MDASNNIFRNPEIKREIEPKPVKSFRRGKQLTRMLRQHPRKMCGSRNPDCTSALPLAY
jgi:hypothetical protein